MVVFSCKTTRNPQEANIMAICTAAVFDDRVRFNWGFHDAQHDLSMGWPNRVTLTAPEGGHNPLPPDVAYCDGYRAGLADYVATGKRNESSESAWQARK
jgi:hypothetical protein